MANGSRSHALTFGGEPTYCFRSGDLSRDLSHFSEAEKQSVARGLAEKIANIQELSSNAVQYVAPTGQNRFAWSYRVPFVSRENTPGRARTGKENIFVKSDAGVFEFNLSPSIDLSEIHSQLSIIHRAARDLGLTARADTDIFSPFGSGGFHHVTIGIVDQSRQNVQLMSDLLLSFYYLLYRFPSLNIVFSNRNTGKYSEHPDIFAEMSSRTRRDTARYLIQSLRGDRPESLQDIHRRIAPLCWDRYGQQHLIAMSLDKLYSSNSARNLGIVEFRFFEMEGSPRLDFMKYLFIDGVSRNMRLHAEAQNINNWVADFDTFPDFSQARVVSNFLSLISHLRQLSQGVMDDGIFKGLTEIAKLRIPKIARFAAAHVRFSPGEAFASKLSVTATGSYRKTEQIRHHVGVYQTPGGLSVPLLELVLVGFNRNDARCFRIDSCDVGREHVRIGVVFEETAQQPPAKSIGPIKIEIKVDISRPAGISNSSVPTFGLEIQKSQMYSLVAFCREHNMNGVALSYAVNSLRDIHDVARRLPEDDAVFAEVRDVLRRHGAEQKFGLALLHKHFDLADDEVMVEFTDLEGRVQTSKPVKTNEIPDGNLMEVSWRLDDDKLMGVCIWRCFYNQNSTPQHAGQHRGEGP